MFSFYRASATLGVFLAQIAWGAAAYAGKPIGLVLAVSGPTDPALATHAEIVDDAPLKLGKDSSLTLIHYRSCQTVTIVGGTVTLKTDGVDVRGGTIQNRSTGRCPREIRIGGSSLETSTGAMVMRNHPGDLRIPPRPAFVVTGGRADQLGSAVVLQDETPVGTLTLSTRTLTWPADREALAPGERYVLRMTYRDGSPDSEVRFVASEPAADVAGRLVILRAD